MWRGRGAAYLMLLRAVSRAFCRLGSPVGSSLWRSAIEFRTSCGFPGLRSRRPHMQWRDDWMSVLTRHLADPLADPRTHTHDADLAQRVLVKPLRDEFPRVLQCKVKPRGPHVAVHHGGGEVQNQDEMADYRAADSCGRCQQSGKGTILDLCSTVTEDRCPPPAPAPRQPVLDGALQAPRLVLLDGVP